ncbi:hypothetical protein BGZ60DRAFT_394855 [Tricladium varicosporioides]|nr:hypothetical protein BGZ60DRAFT_394855 [Hymenoscyphus varicosporioides]
MAKMKNPIILYVNALGDRFNYWSLQQREETPNNEVGFYIPSEFISFYPTTPERNVTRFGGIADALKSYFTSSIVLQTTSNSTALKVDGIYAEQIQPFSEGYDESGNSFALANKCNNSFSEFGLSSTPYYDNPSDHILDQIRQTLLYTSIYVADIFPGDSVRQTIPETFSNVIVNEYQILWRWWAASLTVTCAIVIIILPTFYGFWTLARKPTLSPFETARAFQAPVVSDAPQHLDTPALLKEVGGKNLHTNLVPHTPASPVIGKERGT